MSGVPATARAIAAAWERRAGGATRCTMSEAMHVLDHVDDPPRPAAGTLRLPKPDERDLLVSWMEEFTTEAGLIGVAQAGAIVDARLRQEGLLVWDDDRPVSLIGLNPPVAGVVRIGPVYTPPQLRRRGYAGSAVAAASRRALAPWRRPLHAVHRPGQPDLEQDLRRGGVPALRRLGRDRARTGSEESGLRRRRPVDRAQRRRHLDNLAGMSAPDRRSVSWTGESAGITRISLCPRAWRLERMPKIT